MAGKPDSGRKAEKERGELEMRIDFLIKPKSGSVMDLSMPSKQTSLSLRNIQNKTIGVKQSLSDKLKQKLKTNSSSGSSKNSKFSSDNQVDIRYSPK